MGKSKTAIVIPAFNESETITDVISNYDQYGDLIIIDDGSTDSTSKILEEFSTIKVLSHPSNLGYEQALSTGISYVIDTGYEYVITTDADGELKHNAIDKIKAKLEKGNAMVIGCRASKNRFIEETFGKLSSILFNINDPLCGMKGYSTDFINRYGFFDKKRMIGTELLAYGIRDKASIQEISIDVKKRKGNSRFGGSIQSFFRISRVIILFIRISLGSKRNI